MYTERRLFGHEYAQARVINFDDGSRQLISYSTMVINITADGWLMCTGTYSRTTMKHIGWFMRELGLDYYTAKNCYMNDEDFNIYTGEVRKLS